MPRQIVFIIKQQIIDKIQINSLDSPHLEMFSQKERRSVPIKLTLLLFKTFITVALLSTREEQLCCLGLTWTQELVEQIYSQSDPDMTAMWFYTIGEAQTFSKSIALPAIDNDITTMSFLVYGYSPPEQGIRFFFNSQVMVAGVFFITDENDINSGQTDLQVGVYNQLDKSDYVQCTDIGFGTGIGGSGGAMNCPAKSMRYLEIVQSNGNVFGLKEIRLWTYQILSHTANVIPYQSISMSNNASEQAVKLVTLGFNFDSFDLEKQNSDPYGIEIVLAEYAFMKQVVIYSPTGIDQPIQIDALETSGEWKACRTETINGYTITGSFYILGNKLRISTPSSQAYLKLNKVLILGVNCSQYSLTVSWYDPGCLEVTQPGQEILIPFPAYYESCADRMPDYVAGETISFTSQDPLYGMVTHLTDTNQISIKPSQANFDIGKDYVGVSLIVSPHYNNVDGRRDDDMYFVVYLTNLSKKSPVCESDQCTFTVLLTPNPPLETIEFDELGEEPVEYTIPTIQDQESLDRGDITGTQYCFKRLYKIEGGTYFVRQEQQNSPKLLFQTFLNGYAQKFTFKVIVTLENYPQVTPLEFQMSVKINPCKVEKFTLRKGEEPMNSFNVIPEIPTFAQIRYPRYTPEPLCGNSLDQIDTIVMLKDGQSPPPWINISRGAGTIEVRPNDKSLFGQTFEFKIVTKFIGFSVTDFFRITFREFKLPQDQNNSQNQQTSDEILETDGSGQESSSQEINQKESQAAQQQDQSQSSKEQTVNLLPNGETVDLNQSPLDQNLSWDGWKVLLDKMNLNINIPQSDQNQQSKPKPPKAKFSQIGVEGTILIKFSSNVIQIEDLGNKRYPTAQIQNSATRILNNFGNEGIPFISVKVIPSKISDPKLLKFSHTAEFVDNQTIQLSLLFQNPLLISAQTEKESVEIKLSGPFFDKENGLALEQNSRTLKRPLPPQVIPGLVTETIEATGNTLQASSTSFLAGNALSQFLVQGSLNQVWGMINNLQMVIHTPLLNLQMPGNVDLIFNPMIQVATFDYLPTDEFFPLIFVDLPETTPYNDQFDRLGIGSRFILYNLGTLLIVHCFHLFLLLIYPCLLKVQVFSKAAVYLQRKIRRAIFWNDLIIYGQEAYLDILMLAIINLIYSGSTWTKSVSIFISNSVSCLLLALITALPLIVLLYVCPNFKKLKKSKKFAKKCNALYEMVNLKKGTSVLLWCLLFFMRRICFVAAIFIFNELPYFQILLFMGPNFAVLLCLILVNPLPSKSENRLEIFNNWTLVCMSYVLLFMTEIADTPMVRYNFGYGLISFTVINILVNLIVISKDPIAVFKEKIKVKYRRYKLGKSSFLCLKPKQKQHKKKSQSQNSRKKEKRNRLKRKVRDINRNNIIMPSLTQKLGQSLNMKYQKVKSDLESKFEKATKAEIKETGLQMKIKNGENMPQFFKKQIGVFLQDKLKKTKEIGAIERGKQYGKDHTISSFASSSFIEDSFTSEEYPDPQVLSHTQTRSNMPNYQVKKQTKLLQSKLLQKSHPFQNDKLLIQAEQNLPIKKFQKITRSKFEHDYEDSSKNMTQMGHYLDHPSITPENLYDSNYPLTKENGLQTSAEPSSYRHKLLFNMNLKKYKIGNEKNLLYDQNKEKDQKQRKDQKPVKKQKANRTAKLPVRNQTPMSDSCENFSVADKDEFGNDLVETYLGATSRLRKKLEKYRQKKEFHYNQNAAYHTQRDSKRDICGPHQFKDLLYKPQIAAQKSINHQRKNMKYHTARVSRSFSPQSISSTSFRESEFKIKKRNGIKKLFRKRLLTSHKSRQMSLSDSSSSDQESIQGSEKSVVLNQSSVKSQRQNSFAYKKDSFKRQNQLIFGNNDVFEAKLKEYENELLNRNLQRSMLKLMKSQPKTENSRKQILNLPQDYYDSRQTSYDKGRNQAFEKTHFNVQQQKDIFKLEQRRLLNKFLDIQVEANRRTFIRNRNSSPRRNVNSSKDQPQFSSRPKYEHKVQNQTVYLQNAVSRIQQILREP